MRIEDLEVGDVVYAARDIVDDGSMPDNQLGDILAEAGTRGVIVMLGYMEEDHNKNVFLVRFEDQELNLGRPIGCFSDDLTLNRLSS
ncbi:MAG: nitrogen fixation protein NifZ [Gammaproteobacteria bacterium]